MTKEKENAAIISQEEIAHGIYSMWIRTKAAETAEPGQFISMYTNDGSKLLPRPISICEIDKEKGALRVTVLQEKIQEQSFFHRWEKAIRFL